MGQVIIFGLIVVSSGVIVCLKNYQFNKIKAKRKYERRKKLFEHKNKILDELCRWDKEHPAPIYAVREQKVIYKGDSNLLQDEEFKQALRIGGVINA